MFFQQVIHQAHRIGKLIFTVIQQLPGNNKFNVGSGRLNGFQKFKRWRVRPRFVAKRRCARYCSQIGKFALEQTQSFAFRTQSVTDPLDLDHFRACLLNC